METGQPCPFENVGCKFKHEVSYKCKYDFYCTFKLCQFRQKQKILINQKKLWKKKKEDGEVFDEIEDDSQTDMENSDFEPVNQHELEQNQYNDYGGCSKLLTTKNSFK